MVSRGVKEVQKKLVEKESGICFLAADTYPVDVVAHIPLLCQRANVSYVWLPAKSDIGGAAGLGHATSVIFVPQKASSLPECEPLFSTINSATPKPEPIE